MHKALGRGLESLIPVAANTKPSNGEEFVLSIPVEKIKPNKYQPRSVFNEEKLKELAESIKMHGLAQPLLLCPSSIPGEYELIAGERRWRASQIAGLKEVKAIVRQTNDKEKFYLAIIENIQRENLNPIEEAKAYQRLAEEFNHTQEELANAVGKDRSVIANSLRLLNLPVEVQETISEGTISAGHGRILAGLNDEKKQMSLAERIVKEKLTVREVEKIAADWKTVLKEQQGIKNVQKQEPELIGFGEELQRILGTKVLISGNVKKGKIEIHYYSLEELERISGYLRVKV